MRGNFRWIGAVVCAALFVASPSSAAQLGVLWADASAAGLHTVIAITNTSNSNNTITVEFRGTDGVAVASTSSLVAPGATRVLSSASGVANQISAAVDAEGSLYVSDTAGDQFHIWGAIRTLAAAGIDPQSVSLSWTAVP